MNTTRHPSYENKVAVVTGAGGILCSEISRDLAAKGARVALLDMNQEKLDRVADSIRQAGGTCLAMTANVLDETALQAIADTILATWGPCQLLVNGAGGNSQKAITTNDHFEKEELEAGKPEDMTGFFDLDMAVFENVLKVNTLGTVIPTRVFGRQMAAAGKGAVLNFASMNSTRPLTRVPAYAMSKAAIVNLTQWLATYLAPAGIRVNAVAPGFFINDRSIKILGSPETGLTRRGVRVMDHTPMQRFGNPEDLLGCVSWLLDDLAAAYVTGITVPVDGGFLSHAGV